MLRFLFIALMGLSSAAAAQNSQDRPNIVIIMVDDGGLMDLGHYGGEARTPHIDALAQRGTWFTQFRASPLCSPSRAMLLTGIDNHLTGVATIPEVLPSEHKDQPGYTMALEPGILTLADRLRSAGYRTLMSGKWHLGEEPDEMPQAHGFDRSFALAASGADNWEDRSYLLYYGDAPWFEDGVETSLPEDFYSSRFIVDKMIEYVEETDPDKPFLAYLPFMAVHIPVQAPQEFIDNYDDLYNDGWDTFRRQRHQRAQELGLINPDTPLPDMPEGTRAWEDLTEDEQEIYAARMQVHAGMLEAMDHNVGRFVSYLRDKDEYDNTIFVVVSDNGPENYRGDNDIRLKAWMLTNDYHMTMDALGGPSSWVFIGPEWAAATATPGSLFKFYATEGGVRVPLIMAGPGIEAGRIDSPAMMPDIAPTLLEWVDAPEQAEGSPMTGRSLLSVMRGEADSAYAPKDVRAIEVSGNSGLYKGDYKITRSLAPYGDGQWRLFDLVEDPGETQDLSQTEPKIFEDMLREYEQYAEANGVLPMPDGYHATDQIFWNSIKRILKRDPWIPLIPVAMLAGVGFATWQAVRFFRRRYQP